MKMNWSQPVRPFHEGKFPHAQCWQIIRHSAHLWTTGLEEQIHRCPGRTAEPTPAEIEEYLTK